MPGGGRGRTTAASLKVAVLQHVEPGSKFTLHDAADAGQGKPAPHRGCTGRKYKLRFSIQL